MITLTSDKTSELNIDNHPVEDKPDGFSTDVDWQLNVSDTLDFSDYRRVQCYLQEIPTNIPRLIIDLSGARHIDSSGLGCLLQIYEFCRQHGIALVFNISDKRHQQLLQRTGLWKLFAVAEHALTADLLDS